MFDEIIREIRKLEQPVQVAIPLPSDRDGYVDRQCPFKDCGNEFKVHKEDASSKVGKNLFCPLCRHERCTDEWATKAQLSYVEQAARTNLEERVHVALKTGARRFNARPKSGFVKISLSVTSDRTSVLLPDAVAEKVQQKLTCEKCSCRYASVGLAFFCPACGHNSAVNLFGQTLNVIKKTLSAIPLIHEAFGQDRDSALNASRLVIEQSLGKLVGAFEHFSEATFAIVPGAPTAKVKRGSFQRLNEASGLWREAIGKGYDDILTVEEFSTLIRLFQKRHLLTHADGIVDSDYLNKSGDTEYKVGQRIVVREADVLCLLNLVRKLSDEFEIFLPAAQISPKDR